MTERDAMTSLYLYRYHGWALLAIARHFAAQDAAHVGRAWGRYGVRALPYDARVADQARRIAAGAVA